MESQTRRLQRRTGQGDSDRSLRSTASVASNEVAATGRDIDSRAMRFFSAVAVTMFLASTVAADAVVPLDDVTTGVMVRQGPSSSTAVVGSIRPRRAECGLTDHVWTLRELLTA